MSILVSSGRDMNAEHCIPISCLIPVLTVSERHTQLEEKLLTHGPCTLSFNFVLFRRGLPTIAIATIVTVLAFAP